MLKGIVSGIMLSILVVGIFGLAFDPKQALSSQVYSQNKAPDFTLTDLRGETFCLYNCSARIVLIEFFDTRCHACSSQMPALTNIYGNYSRDQLEMISISLESEAVLLDFVEDNSIEWVVARDTIDLFGKYGVWGVPTSFITDVQRYIQYEHVGLTDEDTLRSEIESLLPKTVYVDDDNTAGPWNGTQEHPYQNITSGLEYASTNDTVYVYSGTYYEHVVVNKTVSLIGEKRSITIIDGQVYIDRVADNIELLGFTIQGFGVRCNSSSNVISGNCIRNASCGILSYVGTSNNTIANNLIIHNQAGIHAYGNGHLILENVIANNTGLAIHTVKAPQRSDRIKIMRNNITNNWKGINICGHWNIISENVIANNTDAGISLRGSTENNLIISNIIINNIYGLVTDFWDNNNTISGNVIQNNTYGLCLNWSSSNVVYHNNFIDNLAHVHNHPRDKINIWDNGCEGNYWSDYNGTDSDGDGIGDTPYIIDENNIDHYPLMNPYWNPADINHDLKVDIYDIVLICEAYGSKPSDINWNCHCDISDPYGIIDIYDVVLMCINYGKEYDP